MMGYIEVKAANDRILEHYKNEFGAIQLNGYRFYLNDSPAKIYQRSAIEGKNDEKRI